jgi:hypothetical protein
MIITDANGYTCTKIIKCILGIGTTSKYYKQIVLIVYAVKYLVLTIYLIQVIVLIEFVDCFN